MNNQELQSICKLYNQHHIVDYIESLTDAQTKINLYSQLQKIDFQLLDQVFKNTQPDEDIEKFQKLVPLKNAQYHEFLSQSEQETFNHKGTDIIKDGRVAVVILAGGQGTRLGFDKAKGMYDIGLPCHKSIFQIFCERIFSLQNHVKQSTGECKPIPIYIMTSLQNDHETQTFFQENDYFGLYKDQIICFTQDAFPMLSLDGRLMMADDQTILSGSNGNGAFLESLNSKGHLQQMQSKGIKYIQLIAIDNVLAKLADPLQIGYMEDKNLLICSKFVKKTSSGEKVGIHAAIDNKPFIIEYSEIPQLLEQALDLSNNLLFNQGNICQMMVQTDFLISLTKDESMLKQFTSKYHVAKKKNNYFDLESRQIIKPTQPNTNKFELFYFDFFSLCEINRFGLFEAIREDEFAPVKNAPGSSEDSPDTARILSYRRDKKWLRNAGLQLPLEDGIIEISPKLTYFGENLEQWVAEQQNKVIEFPLVILHQSEQEKFQNLIGKQLQASSGLHQQQNL